MSVLEDNKAKLREFIESGLQLCLTQDKDHHELPSFHWEMDAGQNAPDFRLVESYLIAAADNMLATGELKKDEPREYMGREFTRLNLA